MMRARIAAWSRVAMRVRAQSLESLRTSLGRSGMMDAHKKAASQALAQLLAVTAMLVIASLVFYTR